MKHSILMWGIVLAGVLAPWQEVFAQAKAPRKTVLKINALSPVVATASGFLEHAFGPRISGQLGAFITGASVSGVKFSGYGFTPEVRYYFSEYKTAPAGLYVAGYGRILNYELTGKDSDSGKTYKATYAPVGAGVAAGGQFIFNKGFALDVFVGTGYNSGSLKINTGTEEDFDTGFLNLFGSGLRVRPGITAGYSF